MVARSPQGFGTDYAGGMGKNGAMGPSLCELKRCVLSDAPSYTLILIPRYTGREISVVLPKDLLALGETIRGKAEIDQVFFWPA